MAIIEGSLSGKNLKFSVISSKWNVDASEALKNNTVNKLIEHGVLKDNIDIFKVPGCLETARIARILSESGKYSSIICLGILINNSLNFNFKANEITRELLSLSVNNKVPIVNGIIMTTDVENAMHLIDEKGINYGGIMAISAIELSNIERLIYSKL